MFGRFVSNKLNLISLVLPGMVVGEVLQLQWIHKFCSDQPFLGASGHCADNIWRISFGWIPGIAVLFAVLLITAKLTKYFYENESYSEVITRILPAFLAFLIPSLMVVNNFRNKKIIVAATLLIFVILLVRRAGRIFSKTWPCVHALFLQGRSLDYEILIQNKTVTFKFRGEYTDMAKSELYHLLAEDVMQIDSDFQRIIVDFSGAVVPAEKIRYMVLQFQTAAEFTNTGLEIIGPQQMISGLRQEIDQSLATIEWKTS